MAKPKFKTDTFLHGRVTQHIGDVRKVLAAMPADSVDCVVTSPPYWGLRDYGTGRWDGGDPDCDHRSPTMREGRNEKRPTLKGGKATNSYQQILAHHTGCGKCGAVKVDDQIGLERSLGEHLAVMVEVFRDVRRVLKPTGTLWLNYGDCYATSPNGRSAEDTKAAGNDDRTFRDKPFSTIGAIYSPKHELKPRTGNSANKNNKGADHHGRIVSGGYLKPKDLCMIPNRLAIALQDDGWWVRSEIIWHKPNPMPESIKDRPGSSHEKIWLLTKSERYFYDNDSVRVPYSLHSIGRYDTPMQATAPQEHQPGVERGRPNEKMEPNPLGRNLRNVWTIPTAPFPEAHFATFPPEVAERCIKAGCPAGGLVLDPFGGSGTTALVAASLGRLAIIVDLNVEYARLARARIESAFMGREEGQRHMTKSMGREAEPGPLFAALAHDSQP